MAVSFGISVGDFIAVGKLIVDITSCLKDAGGSKSEYQELLRELDCLHRALLHLDQLQLHGPSSTNLASIKSTALSCQYPLQEFLEKIKKYDKSLGLQSKEGAFRGAGDKLGWAFGQKAEISKLQGYLNSHIGTINILLAVHGFEKMDLASETAKADQLNIVKRLEDTQGIITHVQDSVTAQAQVVQTTNTMISRLFQMISGDFRISLESLGEVVAKVWYALKY